MKYSPRPKNKKPDVASLVMLLSAVMLFFFGSQYYTKGRAIVQTIGIACLAVSVFFIIKKLTVYTYTVYPADRDTKKPVSELEPEELELIISKRFGAKGVDTNKAMLDIGSLESCTPLPFRYSEKQKVLRSKGRLALYYYTVTFRPQESLLLIFDVRGERTGIVIEPDADFKGFFEEAARRNKEKKDTVEADEDE